MDAESTDLNTALPLFVYGTLCRGMANHARCLAGRFERIVNAETEGQIYLVEAEEYPYLLPGKGTVKGELVFLSPSLFIESLAAIDHLEDFDRSDPGASLYLRQTCQARTIEGDDFRAWTYYWNRSEHPGRLILSGDFGREMRRVSASNG